MFGQTFIFGTMFTRKICWLFMTYLYLILLKTCLSGSFFRIDDPDGAKFYFLSRNMEYRHIVDLHTLTSFGIHPDNLKVLPKASLETYRRGDDDCKYSCEIIAMNISLLQDNDMLLSQVHVIAPLTNPSVAMFKGRYLIAGRTGSFTSFGWLNRLNGTFTLDVKNSFLGIGPNITEMKGERVWGLDPRLINLDDDTFALVMCVRKEGRDNWRPFVAYIGLDKSSQSLHMINKTVLEHPHLKSTEAAKNWSPIVYNNTLHFISAHHTVLEVVRQIQVGGNLTKVVSKTKLNYSGWDFGTMRGGTPLLRLDKSRYMGFFHSARRDKHCRNNRMYFIGAYIISADMPFRMLHISASPIYHPSFYTGSLHSKYDVTYVYFPMSFMYVNLRSGRMSDSIDEDRCDDACMKSHNITLFFGSQDVVGMAGTMNLWELYATMKHVT